MFFYFELDFLFNKLMLCYVKLGSAFFQKNIFEQQCKAFYFHQKKSAYFLQNVKNPMFQVIFEYSDKWNHSFLQSFCLGSNRFSLSRVLNETHRSKIFRLCSERLTFYEIPHAIIESTSLSLNFTSLFIVIRDNSSTLFQLKFYLIWTK